MPCDPVYAFSRLGVEFSVDGVKVFFGDMVQQVGKFQVLVPLRDFSYPVQSARR